MIKTSKYGVLLCLLLFVVKKTLFLLLFFVLLPPSPFKKSLAFVASQQNHHLLASNAVELSHLSSTSLLILSQTSPRDSFQSHLLSSGCFEFFGFLDFFSKMI